MTKALVAINVAVYVAELATGGGVNGTGSTIYLHGVLYGPLVEQGDWWRLLTAAFLHYGPVHLLLNMWALFQAGHMVERLFGRLLYTLVYFGSGLIGSCGRPGWQRYRGPTGWPEAGSTDVSDVPKLHSVRLDSALASSAVRDGVCWRSS